MLKKILLSTLIATICYTTSIEAECVFKKPVEVIESTVGNVISWNTLSESKNERFVIEKSSNGEKFDVIGEVRGAGNSVKEQKYRFLDMTMGENRVYYRLSHIESDGTVGYTPVFIVNRKTDNNFTVTAMSSLITDSYLSLSIRSAMENTLAYKITTIEGKVMLSNTINLVDGVNVLTVDASSLPKAEYFIKLISKTEHEEIMFRRADKKDMPRVDYVVKE